MNNKIVFDHNLFIFSHYHNFEEKYNKKKRLYKKYKNTFIDITTYDYKK